MSWEFSERTCWKQKHFVFSPKQPREGPGCLERARPCSESKSWTSLGHQKPGKKKSILFKRASECYFIVLLLCEKIGNSSWEGQSSQRCMDLCDNKSVINMQTFSPSETTQRFNEREEGMLCFILHIQKPLCCRNQSNIDPWLKFDANTGNFPLCIDLQYFTRLLSVVTVLTCWTASPGCLPASAELCQELFSLGNTNILLKYLSKIRGCSRYPTSHHVFAIQKCRIVTFPKRKVLRRNAGEKHLVLDQSLVFDPVSDDLGLKPSCWTSPLFAKQYNIYVDLCGGAGLDFCWE